MCLCMCMYVCMYVRSMLLTTRSMVEAETLSMRIGMCACVYLFVCMYVCMYVCEIDAFDYSFHG